MLLILTQLKTICRPLTSWNPAPALLMTGLLVNSVSSASIFEQQLEAKELSVSTRYYARGPHFQAGQKWNETLFLKQLNQQNYRLRDASQSILSGDAKKIERTECLGSLTADKQQPFLDSKIHCWLWQNHDRENFLVLISEDLQILATLKGLPWQFHWHAALDPILVAQFRGHEPIMQHEYKISDIPLNCMNAVMAIEDNDFLDHSGVSYTGITRSFIKNIIKMRKAQGGSTITQQLIKNYFLTPEKSLKRKLKEIYLAIKLESQWTKDEILETYLNIIYMGQSGAFQVLGFGAAAEVYFGKSLPPCGFIK